MHACTCWPHYAHLPLLRRPPGVQDLADLADLSLDPVLTDDAPLLAASAGGAGASDPFASLASEPKQDAAMPYATYGQLVTPQAPAQAPAAPSTSTPASGTDVLAASAAAAAVPDGSGLAAPAAPAAQQADPLAGLQGSSQPGVQPIQQQQPHLQQPLPAGVHDLLSAEASTPRLLSPEPPMHRDLPLLVTVSEPVKREATGMLGMKGGSSQHAASGGCWQHHTHEGTCCLLMARGSSVMVGH